MQWQSGSAAGFPALSRRGFLAAGGAAAVGALTTACGAGPAGGSAGGSGSAIDTFSAVFEGSGADESIDPGTSHLFIDEVRLKAMYDGLFEVDDDMKPVPRLAESGEPDKDGTRWRIRLRDARWHDGKKFTGADVLYTLSRILGPAKGKAFIAATTLKDIDLSRCREIGDRTVEIALKEPSFEFLLALSAYGTRIVQDGTKDFGKAVGTGPFRFESFEPGKQLTATAYEDHWNGAPRIQRLRILGVDSHARLAALQSGQADFADDLEPSAVKTLKNTRGMTVNTTPDSGIFYFAMKTDRAPFDNPDVRRALMRMVDREELAKVALEGQGAPANDVFGRGFQYYADDLPQHTFDPAEAKRLLKKAGAEGLSFELFTAEVDAGMVEAAELFAEQAKKSGVKVDVQVGSKDTYYSEAMTKGVLTMGKSGPLPVPNHFASRIVSGSPQNRTYWHDKRTDDLFARAQAARSVKERTALYHEMHERLHDRGGFLFWANSYWSNGAKSEYRNIPTGVPNSLNWGRFDKVSR